MKINNNYKLLYLSLEDYITDLNKIFTKYNVCKSHGIDHAIAVLNHSDVAIKNNKFYISKKSQEAIKLAALLHDADDRKFFPTNTNYENLRYVLRNKSSDFVNLVITMVKLVSSSNNADNVPDFVIGKEWMLIPRYADRIEALGISGIERCLQYNKTKNTVLFLPSTPRPKNEEELWKIATVERYNNYKGDSESMMDHYYDKLLRLGLFNHNNEYLVTEARRRVRPIIDFVLYFSKIEVLTEEKIYEFTKSYEEKIYDEL